MADLKISQLTDGGASQAADEYVVARSGSNFRIDGASVAAAATSVGTLTSLTVSGAITGATSTNTINGIVINSGAITGSKLTVSGVDDAINATYTANSTASLLNLRNATNGTAAVAGLFIGTDASSQTLGIRAYSSGYTTSSIAIADSVRLSVNRPGGLTIDANDSAGVIRFATGGISERMRLDASGNLGLGVTPSAWNTASFKALQVGKGSVSSNSDTAVYLGVNWVSESGGDKYIAAGGASVYSQSNGAHIWYNAGTGAAGGSISFTERARITSGGYFKASDAGTYLGSTGAYHELRSSTASQFAVRVSNTSATAPSGIEVFYTGAAPNGTASYFLDCYDNNAGATQRAGIRSNGGLANYQSNNVDLSDIRTKTDISPAASMWDKVAALEIVTYKYVDQTHDDVNLGVIAQQVEAVEPVWVDADGFGETPEGEEPFKTVYTKDITFAAIKALQEAMARIETLEAHSAALEARLEALEA